MRYASGKVIQGKSWRGTMSGLGKRWVEPFGGGLGAYQQIAPTYSKALVSDLSPVMLMWRAAQEGWKPDTPDISKEDYRFCEAEAFGPSPTPQSVYVLHSSSFRAKANGKWTDPNSSSNLGRLGPKAGLVRFRKVAEVLQLVPTEINQCDYRETLALCGRGDVVYLDPPYGDANYWIKPPGSPEFNREEMLALALEAIGRGAVVFISHYEELPADNWRAVRVHNDASTRFNSTTNTTSVGFRSEYLYVDVRSFYYFDFKQGQDKTKPRTNRTSKQSAVRADLLAKLGPRCEATGLRLPWCLLDLAHHPDFPYSETRDVDPAHCFLLNKTFHAALDEGLVQVNKGLWAVPEDLRNFDSFANANGQPIWKYRRQV